MIAKYLMSDRAIYVFKKREATLNRVRRGETKQVVKPIQTPYIKRFPDILAKGSGKAFMMTPSYWRDMIPGIKHIVVLHLRIVGLKGGIWIVLTAYWVIRPAKATRSVIAQIDEILELELMPG
jgi:uncharacterized protein YjeT (DUF2065 family)